MTNYWPHDFSLEDTASPLEILKAAQTEWKERSDGVLPLVIQEAEAQDGDAMIIIHAKHAPSNRTVSLLSVVHRPGKPYPARIQPRDSDLQDFYKKSYYRRGIADVAAGLTGHTGQHVTNKWVCETPAEFRSKLSEAFNLGVLKAELLSLVSAKDSPPEAESEPQGIEGASDDESDEDESAG